MIVMEYFGQMKKLQMKVTSIYTNSNKKFVINVSNLIPVLHSIVLSLFLCHASELRVFTAKKGKKD